MKYFTLLLLLILPLSNSFSQCYGDYPIYYAKSRIYIYQNQSTNSAIKKEIPKGSSVKVINSFYVNKGWWEVCYKESIGWVKKALLSYTKPTTVSSSNSGSGDKTKPTHPKNKDKDKSTKPFTLQDVHNLISANPGHSATVLGDYQNQNYGRNINNNDYLPSDFSYDSPYDPDKIRAQTRSSWKKTQMIWIIVIIVVLVILSVFLVIISSKIISKNRHNIRK